MDGIDQRHGHVSSNEILRLGFSSNFKQELQYFQFIVDTSNTNRCWVPNLPQVLDGNNGQ